MDRNNYLMGKAFRMYLEAGILTALSAMLGNIVDGVIVSRLIDYNAMSAISLSRPIIQGNYTIYQLLGLGASILVAKAMEQGDSDRVNRIFSLALTVLLCISLTESLLGANFPDSFVNVLCTNKALQPYAREYSIPILIGSPLFYLVYFCGAFTAIGGATKLVSRAMVVDNIVNLSMDVVLINTFHMGVMGIVNDDAAVFSLSDDGIPFNPIENKDKGYGLMIANGASDAISYRYQFGQNMTTVRVKR